MGLADGAAAKAAGLTKSRPRSLNDHSESLHRPHAVSVVHGINAVLANLPNRYSALC